MLHIPSAVTVFALALIAMSSTAFGSDAPLAATVGNGGNSHFPSDFIPTGGLGVSGTQMPASPLVRISNVQTEADSIGVTALKGQIVTQETSVPITPSLPGVSPWGMVLLFGILLLAGYAILRRRQRLSLTS